MYQIIYQIKAYDKTIIDENKFVNALVLLGTQSILARAYTCT